MKDVIATTAFAQPISEQIWGQKYKFQTDREGFPSDRTVQDTWDRLASSCAQGNNMLSQRFYDALEDFKFLPAGRIISGAGTGRNVTLFNCYVMGTIPDSLDSIFDHLKEAALTMQQGGGIGYDFSTLRPKGAPVKGVESFSSGPLTFMDVWDSMCKTIMSAGHRRGAMMATMRCDHPDIEEFITAKKDPTRLRHFNVSVLCTDEFMEAVEHDSDWDLMFNGEVYKTVKAQYLWDLIMENTYSHAEPGVIFIDRINQENNLWSQETIAATNPCGEQPLPPYGACLLGSINLAKMIREPFSTNADIDMNLLDETVRSAVRMLDNVIDISKFPLEAQEIEAKHKRRMGLGVTGVADMFFMIGAHYDSNTARDLLDNVLYRMAETAYEESIQLAKEKGPAPCLKTKKAKEKFIRSGFMKRMPEYIRDDILEHGIRNALLLSIAPTGTISMYGGNVSSGIEPIFAGSYERKITQADGSKTTEVVRDYAVNLFYELVGQPKDNPWWDAYFCTAQDLEPSAHLNMQATAQKWIDSSISKTINLPEDISFDDFKQVYLDAYHGGCKGCTTYRPNDVTGSVLTAISEDKPKEEFPLDPEVVLDQLFHDMRITERPDRVDGKTYKIKWNGVAYYVTFNQIPHNGTQIPFEMFIATKSQEHQAWIAALTRMVSAIFQRGGDVRFVVDEMKSVYDAKGGEWSGGKYVPSLVALLGETLERHMKEIGYLQDDLLSEPVLVQSPDTGNIPDQCPSCQGFNMHTLSGCPICSDCGYSKCS